MKPAFDHVIIVGAGPSGLLLSLLLSQEGIKVTLLDAAHQLDNQPRASHYGPPAIPELRRAGVLDEIKRRGLTLNTMCWRRPADEGHSYIAGFDMGALADVDGLGDVRSVSMPLQELDQVMLERFERVYGGRVEWGHRVTGTGQDAAKGKAWIEVETAEGSKKMEADYVVGCDGANSAVRRSLFGDEYPGFTWEQQIVATNTYYDFRRFGWADANFIISPSYPFMAAIISSGATNGDARKRDLWRVTYVDTTTTTTSPTTPTTTGSTSVKSNPNKPNATREELLSRQPALFAAILPGNPSPSAYEITNFAPYKMHQRLSPSMASGRILLAADASHLCNPFGGLGITGGFVDVGGLADCLVGIYQGKAGEEILETYSRVRKEKWSEIIDPVSTENFKRVLGQTFVAAEERDGDGTGDGFLEMCKSVAGDETKTREMLMAGFGVRYDFTQHYRDAGADTAGREVSEKLATKAEHREVVPTALS